MARALLVRGMLAGLLAGVLATVFAYLAGEPSVDTAIGLEHDHGEELVSRGVQSTLGLFTGVAVYGIAIGGLLAIAFAFVYGRIGTLGPRVTAALLTGSAYVVVMLVPFLKYPANPPSVGKSGTIGSRTELYFGFVALSILFGLVAAYAGRKLADRFGAWTGGLLGCGGYLVAVGLAAWLMPIVNEVPADFPADTLWTFRIASLGTQLTLWMVLGLTFGALSEKVFSSRSTAAAS